MLHMDFLQQTVPRASGLVLAKLHFDFLTLDLEFGHGSLLWPVEC